MKFPLLTNPHIVKAWVKAMGVTYLFCMLILGPVFIATGEMASLPMLALIFLALISGMILLSFLIMLVIFGNRSHAKFVLSEKGAKKAMPVDDPPCRARCFRPCCQQCSGAAVGIHNMMHGHFDIQGGSV